MRFVFLSHWSAERMATSERLAAALGRAGHSILHVVAPRRNPLAARRYNRAPHPLPSLQLWSPFARPAPIGALSAQLALLQVGHADAGSPEDRVVVLQSPRLLGLARRMAASRRIFAALDVLPEVDDRGAIEWADVVFCLSGVQETALRERHPDKDVVNLGQCGRCASEFRGAPDETPTIVYVGLDQPYLLHDTVRRLAALPARLLLVGCDRDAAAAILGGPPPGNVEYTGWLSGDAFGRAVCRGWVGVLPYEATHPRVRQSNPDKVYDYMLGGLQVVATHVPALAGVPGITIAEGSGFVAAVDAALRRHGPDVSSLQRGHAAGYTPERFADEFMARVAVGRRPSTPRPDLPRGA